MAASDPSHDRKGARTRHFGRISIRVAALSGLVTTLTIVLFAVFIIPYQRSILIKRMDAQAEVIAPEFLAGVPIQAERKECARPALFHFGCDEQTISVNYW